MKETNRPGKQKERKITSDGNERDDKVGTIRSDEMRESGGEDVGTIAHSTATLMNEFQFLAFIEGKEFMEDETRVLRVFHNFYFSIYWLTSLG